MEEKLKRMIVNWNAQDYHDEIMTSWNMADYQDVLDSLHEKRDSDYSKFSIYNPNGEPHSYVGFLPVLIQLRYTIRFVVSVYDSGLVLEACMFWDLEKDQLKRGAF